MFCVALSIEIIKFKDEYCMLIKSIVGAGILNMFSTWMVGGCSDFEWFGFQKVKQDGRQL